MFRTSLIVSLLLLLPSSAESVLRLVPAQYATIQLGINAAQSDDTVLVSPGTYSESVTLPHRGITLRSSGGYAVTQVLRIALTYLNGDDPRTGVIGFSVADGLTVDGSYGYYGWLTLDQCSFGPLAGVSFGSSPVEAAETLIRDCIFTGSNGVTNGYWYNDLTVTSCNFQSTSGIIANGYPVFVSGCVLDQGSIQLSSEGAGVLVSGCTLHGGEIMLNNDGSGQAIGNHMTGGAIRVNTSDAGGVYILDNVLVGTDIVVAGTFPVSDVYISGNQLTGGSISVTDAIRSSISGNSISNSPLAISTSSFELELHGNTIRDGSAGIVVNSWPIQSSIVGNDIRGCSGTGIQAPDAEGGVVEQNVVVSCGIGLNFFTGTCRRNTITGCLDRGLVLASGSGEALEISGNLVIGNNRGIVVSSPIDPALLRCNDVWSNPAGNWIGMADPTGQNGNISLDPLFCDTNFGSYTLAADSPCLPGNHPAGADCHTIGALDEGCPSPTVVPWPTEASVTADLLADPNPARDFVRLRFAPWVECSKADIVSVSGAVVRGLELAPTDGGAHSVRWDLRDNEGRAVPAGVYLVRTAGVRQANRVVVVR